MKSLGQEDRFLAVLGSRKLRFTCWLACIFQIGSLVQLEAKHFTIYLANQIPTRSPAFVRVNTH